MTEQHAAVFTLTALDAAALRAAAALLRPAHDPRSRPYPGDDRVTLLADTLDRIAGPTLGLRHTHPDDQPDQ